MIPATFVIWSNELLVSDYNTFGSGNEKLQRQEFSLD